MHSDQLLARRANTECTLNIRHYLCNERAEENEDTIFVINERTPELHETLTQLTSDTASDYKSNSPRVSPEPPEAYIEESNKPRMYRSSSVPIDFLKTMPKKLRFLTPTSSTHQPSEDGVYAPSPEQVHKPVDSSIQLEGIRTAVNENVSTTVHI